MLRGSQLTANYSQASTALDAGGGSGGDGTSQAAIQQQQEGRAGVVWHRRRQRRADMQRAARWRACTFSSSSVSAKPAKKVLAQAPHLPGELAFFGSARMGPTAVCQCWLLAVAHKTL